jgi:hypothetical protein
VSKVKAVVEKEAPPKKTYGKDIRDMTPAEYEKFKVWLANEVKEELEPQPVFYLRGVPYLPHYNKKHHWVGPGDEQNRKTYTTTELMEANAKIGVTPLWVRYANWTKEVKGWKAH